MTAEERRAHAEELLNLIAKATDVTREQMTTKDRHAEVVIAKEIFCHYAHDHLEMSHREIASVLNTDRASVYHLVKKFNESMSCNDRALWMTNLRVTTEMLRSFEIH